METMTEYNDVVETQRKRLKAEEWARVCNEVQCHGLKSMWYETDETRAHFENGMVTDYSFNDGRIERYQKGELIYTFNKPLTGQELLDAYLKSS
jgi:hypothetical protein